MQRFKMPPQILRLVLLTIGIVVSYLVARAFLTPTSFGQYGHFRGDALEEIAAHKISFAGKKACDECHSDQTEKLLKFPHKTLSCETCHGPSQAHADNPDIAPEKLFDADCMDCHSANETRPKWMKQITLKEHFRGQRCVECHLPHQPTEMP